MSEPLTALLEPADLARLGAALAALLGSPVAFSDARHTRLWGEAGTRANHQALTAGQEPIGYLLAEAEPAKLAAAAGLVNSLLVARWQEQRIQTQLATLEARQRQLYESERFAAIGQLAAGVAHEINTPLGYMRSNLNTLAHYLETLGQLKAQPESLAAFWQQHDLDYVLQDSRDLLADCLAGTEHIERIVHDLRGFSCLDKPEMEFVDPGECLSHAVAMINMQKPAAVNLLHEQTPLPTRACQTGLLSQAFLNVLRNAVQAVEYGGDIWVKTAVDTEGSLITIQDTGTGITPECLPHVFEPFFTTRPVGSGTGLGLTVARDAIEAHAGKIEIESQPGQGTTVRIRFPA